LTIDANKLAAPAQDATDSDAARAPPDPQGVVIPLPPPRLARIPNYKPHRNRKPKHKVKTNRPFVQVFHCWLTSVVFRSLTATERMAVIMILSRFTGANNGRLPVSERWLAEALDIGRGTAHRTLDRLKAAGLVEIVAKGRFQGRVLRASRWRVTCHACDVTGRQAEDWTRLPPLPRVSHGRYL